MTIVADEAAVQQAREGLHDGLFRLYGAVSEEAVYDLLIDLRAWEKLAEPRAEATLEIFSHGGNYEAGMALYDYLRMLSAKGHPVKTKGFGTIGSMAGVVFQAGDIRLIGCESDLMIHGINSDVTGSYFTMKNKVDEMGRKMRKLAHLFAVRSGFPNRENDVFAQMANGVNWYYHGQEAIDAGYADAIIGETVNGRMA